MNDKININLTIREFSLLISALDYAAYDEDYQDNKTDLYQLIDKLDKQALKEIGFTIGDV